MNTKNETKEIVKFEPDMKVVKTKVAGMEKAVAAVDITDTIAVKTMAGNIKMLLDYLEQQKGEWVDPAKAIIEKAKLNKKEEVED